jgi:hypothetical protein
MIGRREEVPMASSSSERWPELPYAAWKDTAATLHLWMQVVGKVLLARAPWQTIPGMWRFTLPRAG